MNLFITLLENVNKSRTSASNVSLMYIMKIEAAPKVISSDMFTVKKKKHELNLRYCVGFVDKPSSCYCITRNPALQYHPLPYPHPSPFNSLSAPISPHTSALIIKRKNKINCEE
jgi:hypothetical protein